MKAITTLSVLMLFLTLPIASQSWFEGNPSWYFDYFNPCFTETVGYNKVFFQKDTLLENVQVSKFKVERYRNSIDNPASLSVYPIYLIQDNERVYDYNAQTGDSTLLYDLSLVAGDTISYPLYSYDEFLCDSSHVLFVIDSIGAISFENETLKFQQYRLITNKSTFGDLNFKVIEKIGAIDHNYLIFRYNYHCSLDACNPFTFECYRNETFGTIFPDNSFCDNLLFSEDLKSELPPYISIYPNPSSDFMNVEFETTEAASYQIYNSSGLLVKAGKAFIKKVKISISDLSQGIYFFKVETSKMIEVKRFIKI